MKTLFSVLASSLAAVLVQPLVMFGWVFVPVVLAGQTVRLDQLGVMAAFSALFAAPFVIFLGVPLALVLRRVGRLRWWPLALTGALVGAFFGGWSVPWGNPGQSSGGHWYGSVVPFMVDGQPTVYGWLRYGRSVLAFALHGLLGATAFYWVWVWCFSKLSKDPPQNQE